MYMRKYFKWFAAAVRPYSGALSVVLLCHILLAGCGIAFVYVSKVLVDIAVGLVPGSILLWAFLFAGVIVLRIALNSLRTWLQTKTEVALKNGLRRRLFDNLLHTRIMQDEHRHSGDVVSRFQEDVRVVASTFAVSVPGLAGTVLQFLAAFIFFVILEYRLAVLVVVILPLGLAVGKFITLKIRDLTKQIRASDSKVQSHIQESIQHITVLQSLEHEGRSMESLDQLQGEVYNNEIRRVRFSLFSRVMISIAFSAAQAVAFLWGVVGISHGTVTYGMMTAFLQLLGQIQRPLMEMSSQLPSIIHCTASIDRLIELEQNAVAVETEPVMMEGTAGIRFENVSFSYPGATSCVLRNFSHDFKPGSRTAVMGPTGVGKSTMIKLIMSFLSPSEGKVRIYDSSRSIDVSAATVCNMVFVPQGNSLLSGTIRENLLMGNPNANDEMIREVLHSAAADFVYDLPQGVDTQCFELGAGLSEGQAQRIAVARALLREGSILLLDEFTSALDADTEAVMMKRLTDRSQGHTMIFITHRDRILDYCDSVLRLDDVTSDNQAENQCKI